jgi:FkbH-like protein
LIGKSNQFNLTTRRHSLQQLQELMRQPDCVHLSLRLRDRFTDHGLVSVMMALQRGTLLEIDTWLMSCRVIGRTVEAEMLQQVCREAQRRGCSSLLGTYIPTPKNAMVADVFERFGFTRLNSSDGLSERWEYDLSTRGPITNTFIHAGSSLEVQDGRS